MARARSLTSDSFTNLFISTVKFDVRGYLVLRFANRLTAFRDLWAFEVLKRDPGDSESTLFHIGLNILYFFLFAWGIA